MASALSSVQSEECPVCSQVHTDPRVLDCNHVFCTGCLETLERDRAIACPQCRHVTEIPVGLKVKHLPRKVIKTEKTPVKLVKSWEVGHEIHAIQIDGDNGVIYIATGEDDNPIHTFSFNGRHIGSMGKIGHRRLALDTKRGVLLAACGNQIYVYNPEGVHVGTVHNDRFEMLGDIAYQPQFDRYIVGDVDAHCLYYIQPSTNKIVRTVPADEARVQGGKIRNLYMAANKSATTPMLVTLDSENSLLKLYDPDGKLVQVHKGTGGGYGHFKKPNGVCIDHQGGVVVSDLNNQRMVRLSPGVVGRDRKWQVMVCTEQYGLGHPRDCDVTEDGLAAIAFFSDPKKGPYHLALFSGLG